MQTININGVEVRFEPTAAEITQIALARMRSEPATILGASPAKIVAIAPPAIGELWAEQGGIYAGVIVLDDGITTAHLILAEEAPDKDMKWQAAVDYAAGLVAGGFKDFTLPSRGESLALFQRLKGKFDEVAYWAYETHASDSDYAWCQFFNDGNQFSNHKSDKLRARAVRRLIIQ